MGEDVGGARAAGDDRCGTAGCCICAPRVVRQVVRQVVLQLVKQLVTRLERRLGPPTGRAATASLASGLLVTAVLLSGCATPVPDGPSAPPAPGGLSPDAAALIARAEAALGGPPLASLGWSARGTAGSVGQSHLPGGPWPQVFLRSFARVSRFESPAFREEFVRSRAEPLGGGALPPMGAGEARGVVLAHDGFAWDVAGLATVPAPAAWPARLHDLWLSTPQGALKAAALHGARVGSRREGWRSRDTLSFAVPGQFSATLVLDGDDRVARIESAVNEPLLGELPVITEFKEYRQRSTGLWFPSRIVQLQGGHPSLDVVVQTVTPNPAVEITVPDNVRAARPAPRPERLADGVWLLAGGTHHSAAIELADELLLVEAPLDEARLQALLASARALVPGKPVRRVLSTHHHLDQTGGLRAAAAAGLTLVASAAAQPYLADALARPMRLRPDPLGEVAQPPAFLVVQGSLLFNDEKRPVWVHELPDNPHAAGLLVLWLPRERLLIQADAFTPPPVQSTVAATVAASAGLVVATVPQPAHQNLAQHLARLGLAPLRVVSLGGRVVTAAEFHAPLGRAAPP